jgi:hypothetical protein
MRTSSNYALRRAIEEIAREDGTTTIGLVG